MKRKIIAGTLIALGSILVVVSLVAIGSIWIYRQPLNLRLTAQLQAIDEELGLAQSAFQTAKLELERTLRLVEAAETSMNKLKDEFSAVKTLFDKTNGLLDDQLLPGLKASRGKIDQAKNTLQGLRDMLAQLNSLPLLDFTLPGDQLLADLIASADSLDGEIVHVEDLVKNASTFVSDASYLMGGDFTETKRNLESFLTIVKEYDQKLTSWRTQITRVLGSLPGWLLAGCIGLTIFLLWFGFSQFGLVLHGLAIWRGEDPLKVLKRQMPDEFQI